MMYHKQGQMQLSVLQLHLDLILWDSQLQTAVRVQLVFIVVHKLQTQRFVHEVSTAQQTQLHQQHVQ